MTFAALRRVTDVRPQGLSVWPLAGQEEEEAEPQSRDPPMAILL